MQAQEKILAAQKANEFDLGGHAAKAKGFLEEASKELKLAAIEADKNPGKKPNVPNAGKETSPSVPSTLQTNRPNLAKAQEFIYDAYEKIMDAQRANDFHLKGHAAKAKEFLEQASNEMKLAAEEAKK